MFNKCFKCDKEIDRSKGGETYARECNSCYKKKYYTKHGDLVNAKKRAKYTKVSHNPVQCGFCEVEFIPNRKDAKCCSRSCSDKLWKSKNKEYIKQDQHDRYHNDIQRRISTNIRSRLNKALKGAYKPASIIGSLGCSPEQLKKHLESQFQDNMSWDNYGEWHIDHITPLASYNLLDVKQFEEACHYNNLQPLWAEDNLRKGAG